MPPPIKVNQDLLAMEYAVRGPIAQRAAALRRQGKLVIPCHLGNPQALGQEPIAFSRQVMSLLEDPSRIARERRLDDGERLPEDVIERAASMLAQLRGGMGAYTESAGPLFIREAIASFIDRRDAAAAGAVGGPGGAGAAIVPADPERIYLTNGASEAARFLIEMLIADHRDGLMIPTPQYPLYSATIRKNGGTMVPYFPDEESGWTLSPEMLEEPLRQAAADGVRVKGIVVINPANPTGAVLDEASVEGVVRFAERHGLAIIADEVYQENVYGDRFASFARVVGRRDVPLFSLHSISKGFHGECGHRGGYLEARNPPRIEGTSLNFCDLLLKEASVSLCSNTAGQALTCLMVSPPAEGSPSHACFTAQREGILRGLYEKAGHIRRAFESMEGVRCFGRIGAMYLFPRLEVMPAGVTDFDYCMALLEETGFCTVNGGGFGQKAGTQHLRIAFLPPIATLDEALPRWIEFHNRFVRQPARV